MADTLDIISLADARRLIGISPQNTDHDADIATLITAVSRRVDEIAGPVVNRTVSAELHDGGCPSIRLNFPPVSSFTTVTEYTGTTGQLLTAETNASKTANNYLWDETVRRLYRRASGADAYFPAGRKNVAVTYVAGRAATTSVAPVKFRQAVAIILAHLWRADRGAGSETFGGYEYPIGFAIPNRALEVLGDDVRGPLVA